MSQWQKFDWGRHFVLIFYGYDTNKKGPIYSTFPCSIILLLPPPCHHSPRQRAHTSASFCWNQIHSVGVLWQYESYEISSYCRWGNQHQASWPPLWWQSPQWECWQQGGQWPRSGRPRWRWWYQWIASWRLEDKVCVCQLPCGDRMRTWAKYCKDFSEEFWWWEMFDTEEEDDESCVKEKKEIRQPLSKWQQLPLPHTYYPPPWINITSPLFALKLLNL